MTSPPCPACPRKGNRSSNAHRVPRSALPHPENKPSFNTQTHSAAHPGPDAAQGAADTPQRPPGRDDDLKNELETHGGNRRMEQRLQYGPPLGELGKLDRPVDDHDDDDTDGWGRRGRIKGDVDTRLFSPRWLGHPGSPAIPVHNGRRPHIFAGSTATSVKRTVNTKRPAWAISRHGRYIDNNV